MVRPRSSRRSDGLLCFRTSTDEKLNIRSAASQELLALTSGAADLVRISGARRAAVRERRIGAAVGDFVAAPCQKE